MLCRGIFQANSLSWNRADLWHERLIKHNQSRQLCSSLTCCGFIWSVWAEWNVCGASVNSYWRSKNTHLKDM